MNMVMAMSEDFSGVWLGGMLRTITEAQQKIMLGESPRPGFDCLLDGLLRLTGSEYGFVGEVLRKPDGTPYLRTHSITDIAWNDETRAFYETYKDSGLEFHNLNTLFGRVLVTGEPLITNDPATHDAAGGLPKGHPPLRAFLGLPLCVNGELVGMAGLSNRAGGYEQALVDALEPIVSAAGYMIVSVREKRERVAAEARVSQGELLRHSVVETALDCVIAMDHKGDIIEFNPAAEHTFGWGREEVLGRNLAEIIIPENLRKAHSDGMDRYLATGAGPVLGKRIEVTSIRRDGTEFPVELAVTVAELSDHPVFTAYIRDITERRRAEEDLRRAREAAESASKAKSIFVATVSHEVRTPINAIIGALGLLQETELDAADRQYLDTAHRSAEALLGLVNDVLDLSRIDADSQPLESEPTSPSELCDSVLQLLAERAGSNGNRLAGVVHRGVPDKVWIDGGKVRQVLLNLVGNAVKFTRDGTIRIDCERDGDGLRFSVRDDGIGIAEDDLPEIFSEFTQFGDARERGGAGLGLAICRRLVDLMGGEIEVQSTLGKGSLFGFRIPFAKYELASEARLSGRHGLLVGGSAFVARALADQCQAWGAEIEWLPDPQQAGVAAERDRDVDFVLLLLERLPCNAETVTLRTLSETLTRVGTPLGLIAPGDNDCADCLGERVQAAATLTSPVLNESLARCVSDLLGGEATATGTWSPPSPHARDTAHRVRVLLADDSQANRLVMSEMLRRCGFDVDTVADGSEAVEAIRSLPYDIVLMDIEMPQKDGIEATREIRALDGPARDIPIVALTANVLADSRERFLSAGMNDYVSKPVDRTQLSDVVDRWARAPDLEPATASTETAVDAWLDGDALRTLGEDTDPTLVPKMVEVFVAELTTRAESMGAGLEAEDIVRLGHEAHALKSSAATYGACRISELATRIDEACKRNDRPVALAHARALIEAVAPTVESLKTHPLVSG